MCLAGWLNVEKYLVTSLKWLLLFQPGEKLFPTDENGRPVFDSVDLCRTWEVSPGRREPGEGPGEGEPPSFLPPVRMGCGPSDSAVHECKGWDAGVVGREPLLKCSQRGMKWRIWDSVDRHLFPSMWLSSPGFSKEEMILLLVSWPSSPLSSW